MTGPARADRVAAYDRLVAGLPEVARKGATRLHEAHGIVQKGYVTVPDELLDDTERLLTYLKASYAYALTLKPKATNR